MDVAKQTIMDGEMEENDSFSDENSDLEDDHQSESIYQLCMAMMEKNWMMEQCHALINDADMIKKPTNLVQVDKEHSGMDNWSENHVLLKEDSERISIRTLEYENLASRNENYMI